MNPGSVFDILDAVAFTIRVTQEHLGNALALVEKLKGIAAAASCASEDLSIMLRKIHDAETSRKDHVVPF